MLKSNRLYRNVVLLLDPVIAPRIILSHIIRIGLSANLLSSP